VPRVSCVIAQAGHFPPSSLLEQLENLLTLVQGDFFLKTLDLFTVAVLNDQLLDYRTSYPETVREELGTSCERTAGAFR
jgi:hypothetical protein